MNFHSHTAHLKQARTTHSERPEITSLDREEKRVFLSSDRDGRIVSLGKRYGGIAAWVHRCVSSPEGYTTFYTFSIPNEDGRGAGIGRAAHGQRTGKLKMSQMRSHTCVESSKLRSLSTCIQVRLAVSTFVGPRSRPLSSQAARRAVYFSGTLLIPSAFHPFSSTFASSSTTHAPSRRAFPR